MGEAWAWLGIVAAVIGAVWAVVRKVATGARAVAETKGLREYQATRKAMDDVETGNDDPAVLRDWLRERGKPKRDL